MISLIIDCSYGMKLYLLKDGEVFAYENDDEKKHTDSLLVELDSLLNLAKVNADEIDNFCVCTGPGSFTGIRVAISILKGLAVESNAKVFALSNLDFFDFKNTQNTLYILNGFSEFVYVRKFENGNHKDLCLSFDDLIALPLSEYKKFVLNKKMQEKLRQRGIDSKVCDCKIVEVFKKQIKIGKSININQIEPVYLRASQAEIERNKKLEAK